MFRESLNRLSSVIIVATVGIVVWIGLMVTIAFIMAIIYPLVLVILVVALLTGSISSLNELIRDATQKVKDK